MTTTTKQKKPKRRRSPFFFRCCRPKSDLRRLEKISVFPVVLGPLVAPRESEGEREREAVLFSPLFRVKGKKKSAVFVFPFGGACFFVFLLLCYFFIFERGAFENCKENRRTHEKRKRERKRGGGGGGRGLREVRGRNDESSHAAAATSSTHFFYLRRLSACGKTRQLWRLAPRPAPPQHGRGSTPVALRLLTWLDRTPAGGDQQPPRLPRRRGPAVIRRLETPRRRRRCSPPTLPSPARGRGLPRTRSLLLPQVNRGFR